MTRRKSVCLKWTLVLLLVLVCSYVHSRPQEAPVVTTSITPTPIRDYSTKTVSSSPELPVQRSTSAPEGSARDVKSKTPIRDSIEMVAIQLLNKPNLTMESSIVSDTRIPPKLKTQVRHKIKTRNDDGDQLENAHPGEAVPVNMEELDTGNKITEVVHESSTSNEGISTWISLSNASKENTVTEPTKIEEKEKKPKPVKNKPKRPQTNKISKRPIIGSTNKADLVAGGSAINENVYNKLKDTVLANVQKNKNAFTRPSTTSSTTTTTTEIPTTKKETKATIPPTVTGNTKQKKRNKNKPKITTTLAPPAIDESALLPTEAKEQEIELEVSTPAMTTKKPKRSSNKKKNKTKRRKTSTPKPSTEVAISDVKTSNKTKAHKNSKKPAAQTGAITTQIYNYLSREVMPSVGVGVLGLASLVGIAGYFLYPFATPVRRTFEVDKSDDLYRNNAEEYANDGNGQAEEEMLGTVLAGMPAHAKQKLNPYAAQTPHINRYPTKKEQDIRYRHVTPSYNPNYKVHYAQQKTGIAHAAVYSKPVAYNPYETHNAYTTERIPSYEKPKQPNYTPYSAAAVEPIYAALQTGPSGVSSYGSDTSNSVVYGVKPSSESDFKPVYPFDGQLYSETTSSPATYSPTSMYLGLNSNGDNQEDVTKYEDYSNISSEGSENQFVVGNVPKELSDSATPAVVPEHGPRNLRKRRSISESLEDFHLHHDPDRDVFSNEIDDFYSSTPLRHFAPLTLNEISFTPNHEMTSNDMSELSINKITAAASNGNKLGIIRSIVKSTSPNELANKPKLGVQDISTTPTEIYDDDDDNDSQTVLSVSNAPITGGTENTEMYDDNGTDAIINVSSAPGSTGKTKTSADNITGTVESVSTAPISGSTGETKTSVDSNTGTVESVSTAPISGSTSKTETEETTETTESEPVSAHEEMTSTTPDTRRINPVHTSTTTEQTVTKSPTTNFVTTPTPNLKLTHTTTFTTKLTAEKTTEETTVKNDEENSTQKPDLSTYPPPQHFGIYGLLQKLVIFKLKLGLELIENTVQVLNKLKIDTKSVLNNV